MLSSYKSLRLAFRPISISLQLFGLHPFYTNNNNELRFSYWRASVTIFYLVTSFVITYLYYSQDVENDGRINRYVVVTLMSKTYFPGLMFLMLISYIYRFIKFKSDKLLVSQILNIIQLLESSGMTNEIKVCIKHVFRYTLHSVLTVIIGVLSFDTLFSQILGGYKYGHLIVFMINWPILVSNAVMANNQVLIASWLMLIQKLYEVLNIAYYKIFNSLRNDTDFLNTINLLLDIHKKLTKCLSDFGQFYSFRLLIFIVFNYLTILLNLYFIISYTVFEIHINEKRTFMTFFIKTAVQSMFHLYFVTTHIVAIVKQVSKHFF